MLHRSDIAGTNLYHSLEAEATPPPLFPPLDLHGAANNRGNGGSADKTAVTEQTVSKGL